MAKEMNMDALNANLRMLDKQGEMNLELLRRQDTAAAEKLEKIGVLLKDEQFAAEFFASDSAAEAVELFAAHSVELSDEEVTSMAKQIVGTAKMLIENGGELSEEELEQIAGGWSWEGSGNVIGPGAIAGAAVGTAICPLIGTGAGFVIGALGGFVGGGLFYQEIKTGLKAVKNTAKKVGKFFSNLF